MTNTRSFAWCILALAPSCALAYTFNPSDFATRVITYSPGLGPAADFITGIPCTDPATALGRPTIDTTGDLFNMPESETVPIVPVYGPFRATEIVSLGQGGQLILEFDHRVLNDPANPFGLDLIIFGNPRASVTWPNNGYWLNRDPQTTTVGGPGFTEHGIVRVSQDGLTWYTFDNGPFADGFAPTLGRVYDPAHPDPSVGPFNQWWADPTDPTLPLDPALTASSFSGKSVAEIAQLYGQSAGGTGFDIGSLGLDWIQFVMIQNPLGSGLSPEIDAVADAAAVPEPGIGAMLMVGMAWASTRPGKPSPTVARATSP